MTEQEWKATARGYWEELAGSHLKGEKYPTPDIHIESLAMCVKDYLEKHPDELGISLADLECARVRAWRVQATYFWRKTKDGEWGEMMRNLDLMHECLRHIISVGREGYDKTLVTAQRGQEVARQAIQCS